MTETEQLHQDFLKDFTKLLRRYDAEFEMIHFERENSIAEVYFNGSLNEDGDPIRPYSTIELPDYINPN